MLDYAEYDRYRGFERLRVGLAPHAFLIGPNSAGKSSVVESIGLAEKCLQIARRKAPQQRRRHRGVERRIYAMPSLDDPDEIEDPVRFDFGYDEARASLYWANGASIHMVWPDQREEESAFFYLDAGEGATPRSVSDVRELFAPITIVPIVTPLDRVEELKNEAYVRRLASSRLASRHFRNHLFQMNQVGDWRDFSDWVAEWLPDLELTEVDFDVSGNRLAVFYREVGSRVPKELAWAGDGIQIWIQILWHVFRLRDNAEIVVLDEPEVYLHPDLQRRLVRLLDSLSAQIVLASHSVDVIAEAPPDAVVWVDRRAHAAKRAASDSSWLAVGAGLGSAINLALARANRVTLAVATDVADPRVLRALARCVGATHLASEVGICIVPVPAVEARSRDDVAFFRSVLPQGVQRAVLLEFTGRTADEMSSLRDEFASASIEPFLMSNADLTGYLIEPSLVARCSGAATEAVREVLDDLRSAQRHSSRARFSAVALLRSNAFNESSVLDVATAQFDELWSTDDGPLRLVRGLDLLPGLNEWLRGEGYRIVTPVALARAARPQSLAPELFDTLMSIEELV